MAARRDWGYAADYVAAMWQMMQADAPDDYVIATGQSHSVREFLDLAGAYCGLDWMRHVRTDPRYFRPTEVDYLLGDAAKARRELGWSPKVNFEQLVRIVMNNVTVFEGPRLGFIGVADQINRSFLVWLDETPFQPARKPRASSSAQGMSIQPDR